jgi:hypothetical protein
MDDIEIFCCVELAELLTRLRAMAPGEEREQILGTVGEVVFVRIEEAEESHNS